MIRNLFTLFGLLLTAFACPDIQYTIEPEPAAKTLRVSMRLEAGETQEFRIPAWCPGFYFLQKYHEKISDVVATDVSGARLTVTKSSLQGWTVQNPAKSAIRLSYRVLGDDGGLGFFNVSVRNTTAFMNGPAAFMFPVGRLEEPITLQVKNPTGWDVATGLEIEGANYTASGYDEFIDCPIQLGKFERRKFGMFEAVFVSMNGKYVPDLDYEVSRLAKIVKPAISLFGGAPFKKYLFIIHLDPGSFDGGLEHRSSNVINTANAEPLMIDSLFAHEYFHAWNVKQIRPKVLGPFDYTQPVRTGNLWFAEGVTDYYGYLTCYRSGLQNEDWLLENYSFQVASVESSKVARRKTLEAVSKGTWETGGFGDGDLSYYEKGQLCGLLFDARIRKATDGQKSLDDVMRLLYERHRLPKPGFEEDGILKALNEVAGVDLEPLYRRLIQSTQPLPFELMNDIGLRVRVPGRPDRSLGVTIRNGVVLDMSNVLLLQGLRPNDRVIEVNQTSYSEFPFDKLKVGEKVILKISRGEATADFNTEVTLENPAGYRLERDPFANPAAVALLKGWLKKD